jgi:hypothetical protein
MGNAALPRPVQKEEPRGALGVLRRSPLATEGAWIGQRHPLNAMTRTLFRVWFAHAGGPLGAAPPFSGGSASLSRASSCSRRAARAGGTGLDDASYSAFEAPPEGKQPCLLCPMQSVIAPRHCHAFQLLHPLPCIETSGRDLRVPLDFGSPIWPCGLDARTRAMQ